MTNERYPVVPEGFNDSEPPRGIGSQRLAVLGDPVGHSRSPQLQLAAYRALGRRWEYSRWRIPAGQLAAALDARSQGWRGFSVTAPLKAEALAFASEVSADARRSGAVNTLVFDSLEPGAPARGENTDIPGIVRAFGERDLERIEGVAHVLGAGETAASVAIAAQRLGASRVEVYARRPERAEALAERLGDGVTGRTLADWVLGDDTAFVGDTVPGGYALANDIGAVPAGAALLSAAYHPWPTPLAERWQDASAPVVTGLDMLLHQAVLQVRLFGGDAIDEPLPNEAEVVEAMRAALS
ncbi:shikimate dehydrogenase family protein [Gulosibacter sediminis]|uniref:shikimate dehydrogenase family protein n=1 Tax=Gulosibacter sediminis TaxID=1729695 RepID=UPI0018696291|nr:shikimate dehydrogenase [Gulosibacter sediminis]